MRHIIFPFCFIYLAIPHLSAQDENKPFQTLIVGTSITYIWDPDYRQLNNNEGHLYQELTWNLNIATYLNRRIKAGLGGLKIWTKSPLSGKNNYFVAGAFGQYDVSYKAKNKFALEAGIFFGDYCTCDPEDPYRKNGLVYWELGFAYTPKLWKGLYLDLGFNVYNIANKVLGDYSYTQYVIGLDYRFGR